MRRKNYCHFCAAPLEDKHIEGRVRLFCSNCDYPLYENPIPATCVVVADDRNRVMLIKRNVEPQKGGWCLPGGFVELGERPEQAALRELREETGISGRIERLLGVETQSSQQYHTVLIVGYLVRQYEGAPAPGDDAADLAFYNRNSMPPVAFASHSKLIEIYYANG